MPPEEPQPSRFSEDDENQFSVNADEEWPESESDDGSDDEIPATPKEPAQ